MIQEVVLAKRALAFCGEGHIDWNCPIDALCHLYRIALCRMSQPVNQRSEPEVERQVKLIDDMTDLTEHFIMIAEAIHSSKFNLRALHSIAVTERLQTCRDGLCALLNQRDRERIVVDYDKSYDSVFGEFEDMVRHG